MKNFSSFFGKIIVTFLLVFLIHSCVDLPSDIVLPNWDVSINLPLTDKSYVLEEVIEVQDDIKVVTENGVRVYSVSTDDFEETFTTSEFLEGKLNGSFDAYSFPIATGDTSESIALASGAEIDSAHLKKGRIVFNINNTSNEEVTLIITFPGLRKPDASAYSFEYALNPMEVLANQTVNIANYSYTTSEQDDNTQLIVDVQMIADNPTLDEIEVSFSMLDTDFYYMNGVIPTLELDPIREGVELPLTEDSYEARDQLFLKNASMSMRAEYEGPLDRKDVFTVDFNGVQITGLRNDGTTFKLTDKSGNETLSDITVRNGIFERTFDNSNSNISDFLSFLPDSIIIDAGITMNPEGTAGASSDQDLVKVTFSVEAISELYISGSPIEHIETIEDSSETSDAFDSEELENILLATLFYEITNGIPIQLDLDMEFQTSEGDSLFVKSVNLESADMTGRYEASPKIQTGKLELTQDEIATLSDMNQIVISWTPSTTDEAPFAYFGPDQSLSFKSWLTIDYHVDLEDDEEGGN